MKKRHSIRLLIPAILNPVTSGLGRIDFILPEKLSKTVGGGEVPMSENTLFDFIADKIITRRLNVDFEKYENIIKNLVECGILQPVFPSSLASIWFTSINNFLFNHIFYFLFLQC